MEGSLNKETGKKSEHWPPLAEWRTIPRIVVFTAALLLGLCMLAAITQFTFWLLPDFPAFVAMLFLGGCVIEVVYRIMGRE